MIRVSRQGELMMGPKVTWPEGKAFAFTVFDDTDCATLENVGPVYSFLADLGFRTTKSVWPIAGLGKPVEGGATCDDPAYRRWVRGLQDQGFEIGLHNATYHTSTRDETRRGLDVFREIFQHDPKTFANHTSTEESLYWYEGRLTGIRSLAYTLLTRGKYRGRSRGHHEGDPLFWGDLCRQRIQYVRNFVFGGMNTLKACPWMPYHDPARPYVNYWFASSPGRDCKQYNETITEAEQDQLEAEGGACIMYTHFGVGFCNSGCVDSRFKALMTRLAKKNGFFVPVGVLLDYLQSQCGQREITPAQRRTLECRWIFRKFRVGSE